MTVSGVAQNVEGGFTREMLQSNDIKCLNIGTPQGVRWVGVCREGGGGGSFPACWQTVLFLRLRWFTGN